MSAPLTRRLDDLISQMARIDGRRREGALIDVARGYLPRPLRWAADRPRVLRVLYRVRPSWRPMIAFGVDGDITVAAIRRADGSVLILEPFQRALLAHYLDRREDAA